MTSIIEFYQKSCNSIDINRHKSTYFDYSCIYFRKNFHIERPQNDPLLFVDYFKILGSNDISKSLKHYSLCLLRLPYHKVLEYTSG